MYQATAITKFGEYNLPAGGNENPVEAPQLAHYE